MPRDYRHGTGIRGDQDDEFGTYDNVGRIEKKWPRDSMGSRLSLGNTVAGTMKQLPDGVITTQKGNADPALDPPVSQAQNRLMHAAASGSARADVPKSVGQEYVKSAHGMDVSKLPERKG